jgi:hypothetical protein
MTTRSATLNVMIRAADKAARQLRRDFGEIENLQVSKKGPADFVSTADTAAENIIREELLKARPDYGFIMEEAGTAAGNDKDERCWVVDPLDGTSNFLHGLPHWAISIALAERGQVPDQERALPSGKRHRRFPQRSAYSRLIPPAPGRMPDRHRRALPRSWRPRHVRARDRRGHGGHRRDPPLGRGLARSRLCGGRAL